MKPLIAFLSMLKEDIKKCVNQKAGASSENELLTGQTITEREIISLSAYKLMTIEERQVVHAILDSMRKDASKDSQGLDKNKQIEATTNGSVFNDFDNKTKNSQSLAQEKVLLKRIDGIIPFPKQEEQDIVIDYKDAA